MILSSTLQAIGLFLVTNIDDIIVLSLFFGRGAGQRGTTVRILVGQYLGFAGILGAAVAAYCIVFLALVAVLVGLAKFVATRRPIAEVLERWEHILFPIVLIGLGFFILVSGGAFGF